MAKKNLRYSFNKGELTKENDDYIITEVSKDDSIEYSLSDVLDGFVGLSGVNIVISVDDEVPNNTDC